METKNIYNMKLHELLKINDNIIILRVSGGWVYNTGNNIIGVSSVFVPNSSEFKQKTKAKIVKDDKLKFGDINAVLLTQDEYDKLVARFGFNSAIDRINKLGYYCLSTGKKYESHYATILNWARHEEDRKLAEPKKKEVI